MKTHLSRRLAFIEAPFALERVDKRKYPLKKVKIVCCMIKNVKQLKP